jgi:hypothetical protein
MEPFVEEALHAEMVIENGWGEGLLGYERKK